MQGGSTVQDVSQKKIREPKKEAIRPSVDRRNIRISNATLTLVKLPPNDD